MPTFEGNFDRLLFATVRLRATKPCKCGTKFEYGTAFVFDYEAGPDRDIPLLVTCKHVVEGSTLCEMLFAVQTPGNDDSPRQLALGGEQIIRVGKFDDYWFSHPNPKVDVALRPLVPLIRLAGDEGVDLYTNSLPSSLIPSPAQMSVLDVRQPIVFVGYPYGFMDDHHLLPLIRSGWTASRIDLPFGGEPGFFVDAPFHKGSSGSPVMLIDNWFATREDGAAVMFPKNYLLGMATTAHLTPDKENMGLGFATSADMILDTAELFLRGIGAI